MAYTNATERNTFYVRTDTRQSGPLFGGTITSSVGNNKYVQVRRTGGRLLGWRKIIESGGDATTSYSLTGVKLEKLIEGGYSVSFQEKSAPPVYWGRTGEQSFTGHRYNWNYGYTGDLDALFSHLPASIAIAEAVALKKIYQKINQELTHLNSFGVLAELAETISMFGRPFRGVVDLVNKNTSIIRKEKLRGLHRVKNRTDFLQLIAGTYLEFVFGLKPLISDTEAIAEAVARWEDEAKDHPSLRTRFSSRGSDTKATSTVQLVPNSPLWGNCLQTTKTVTDARVQYTVGARANLTADWGSVGRLQELLGFRFDQFIPGLYQGIPWSWLFDYFTNLGDIIEAGCTSTSSVTWVCRSQTLRTRQIYQSVLDKKSVAAAAGAGIGIVRLIEQPSGTGVLQLLKTTHSRAKASLGVPPVIFKNPFKDVQKTLNMAAVAIMRSRSVYKQD